MINTNSRHRNRGFTIIELLIVMAILGMLAVMVAPNLFKKADGARHDAALSQISAVGSALATHRLDVGRSTWDGPYLNKEVPRDPWGNEYQYTSNGSSYTLTSFGADGRAGGEDNDADITN